MLDLFLHLLQNTGMLALAAIAYGVLVSRIQGMAGDLLLGLLFGLGAVLSMLTPVELLPGIFVDTRSPMIILASFFGGPIAAAASGAIALSYRMYLGGAGLAPAIAANLVAIAIGLAAHYLFHADTYKARKRHVLILAAASPITMVGALLLPADLALSLVPDYLLPVVAVRVIGVAFLGLVMLGEQNRSRTEARVRRLAYVDELSGLANRRAFSGHLDREWKRWERYKESFSVVLVDIDRFKVVNDTFGHPTGDRVIQRLAEIMLEESRGSDLVARTGGEEFGLILPYTTSATAYIVAERIRARVEREEVVAEEGRIRFTVSLGVSADVDNYPSMSKCLSGADHALYEAKHLGRNTVVIDTPGQARRDNAAPSAVVRKLVRDKR